MGSVWNSERAIEALVFYVGCAQRSSMFEVLDLHGSVGGVARARFLIAPRARIRLGKRLGVPGSSRSVFFDVRSEPTCDRFEASVGSGSSDLEFRLRGVVRNLFPNCV